MLFDRMIDRWGRGPLAAVVGVPTLLALAVLVGAALRADTPLPGQRAAPPSATVAAPGEDETVPPAAPAPAGLPVVDYDPAPAGFPADPHPLDVTPLTEGLTPTRKIAAYDAPGGRPRALLAPTISGVELTMPVVERRTGWTAVLLPSASRRLAWLPDGGWTKVALRDQIVVQRRTHQLTWYRHGKPVRTWSVSLGLPGQETPLGRTFILGTTPPPEPVYGGVDIFALGAVPDDPDAVPSGLKGAHIGLHTWQDDDTLGQDVTNGCVRLTRTAQQTLLTEIRPGTELVVVDALPTS
ncbi:L,D-transpeptidase [Micromonospora sp. WMMD987]|uniref:L,D-transpeptidase n=1 Tax=Micromonospora sp. WMMD987 TaxID=3016089 RepID=UPI00249CF241|nr:L,D-transpeptidase [Micromonospora sp. WMMD987]WFE94208.1 L,D-transpeptidase [Micromonospora sp. WMMD987]